MLAAHPEGDVTLDFSSSAPAEGSVNPRRITFTPRNWNAPQVITVTGLDDSSVDGDAAYRVRGSVDVANSDPGYGALPAIEVTLVNLDNDTPGISITPLDNLTTTEGGGKATFSVALRSRPSSNVRIDLSTSNAAEGSVFPAALTFTQANFAAPQQVTVTGADDMLRDGNQPYSIVTAPAVSNDDGYKNLDAPNVTVVNIDDDSPGVIVVKSGDLTTTESGGTATFALKLATLPKGPVAINISSTNAAEGEVTPGIVNFTAANWSSPQTVTVAGKDDAFADGTQPYRVIIAPAASSDPDYQGVDAEDIAVVNLDDETAGVIVSADAHLTTTEGGGTARFSIVLGSPPTGLGDDHPHEQPTHRGNGRPDSNDLHFGQLERAANRDGHGHRRHGGRWPSAFYHGRVAHLQHGLGVQQLETRRRSRRQPRRRVTGRERRRRARTSPPRKTEPRPSSRLR